MKLHTLYDRPINRRIDPVATVSELDPKYVEREIEEYFFTDTLFDHLYTFLKLLTEGTEGRTGIWINGYYGSGKSHFLKYIYYCLSQDYSKPALNHFETSLRKYEGDPLDQPVTEGNARAVHRKLETLTVEPIMFNIKAVSGEDREQGSITKTFYNRLNAFRGYNKANIQIARFEKLLDDQGKLEAFREAYQNTTGDVWAEKANDAVDFMLDEVLQVAQRVADIDAASSREALQRAPDVTTEAFVDELEQFLRDKPDGYRLVYLVDEVSQYMQGEPNLLLDLQTIVEEVGTRLGDTVWVVCTAQQELKELVDDAQRKQQADYSYGKIMGRFETSLPLESQQADLITKKRVLDKSPEGREALRTYFNKNETHIRNQFQRSNNDLYRGYGDQEAFVVNYPFIPYQFKLIIEVIRAFEAADFFVAGVSSTERSLIGNTHHVAKACKDYDVGYFVPFDEFYNATLADKLTHRARSIIGNALQLERVRQEAFSRRIVKALFLLSNLTRDQSINFPSTAENIAFVLIDELDPNWAELKRQTQDVLDYLVSQNVVSESEGTYRFLQEEEIRVKREINNHKISQHDRLTTFATEVVQQQLQWSSRADLDGTTVRLHLKVDDHEESSTGDVAVQILLYAQDDPDHIAIARAKDELVFCLHKALNDDQRARLDEAVRINAYVQDHLDSASGERLKAMEMFKNQSKRALTDLRRWFDKAMKSVAYVSGQQVYQAGDRNGQSAKTLYEAIIDDHLRRVYHKRDLATAYAGDRTRLREIAARRDQTEIDDRLTPAETEMNSYLMLEPRPTVADVLRRYGKAPYGWKDTEVIHVLLNLEYHNKWTFRWNSEEVGHETFVEKAIRRQEQASVTLHKQEDVDPQLMHEVVQAINQQLFNEKLLEATSDPKQLDRETQGVLKQKRKQAATQASDHRGRPFARHFEDLRDALHDLEQQRETASLFEAVRDQAESLAVQVDCVMQLADFWERHGETYQAMRGLVDQHEANFPLLDATTHARARKLSDYVRTHDKPYESYRTALDYYEAVQDAIDKRVTSLREEAEAAYAQVFDDLEGRRKELGVTDVLPDRDTRLSAIRLADNLATLQNHLSRVSDFRAEYLVQLNDAAAKNQETGKTSVVFNVRDETSSHELTSEDDVDTFVKDLRAKLLRHIGDNKIVIIK